MISVNCRGTIDKHPVDNNMKRYLTIESYDGDIKDSSFRVEISEEEYIKIIHLVVGSN